MMQKAACVVLAGAQKFALYIDPLSPSLPFLKLENFGGLIINR